MKKTFRVALLIVGSLVVFRLCLPSLLTRYVNKTLDKIPGYKGHVSDINVSLWRGAYQIIGVELLKLNGKVAAPFFSADLADLSVQWKELFHGALVGTIALEKPRLNFVVGGGAEDSQTSIDKSWQGRVQELFPLDINRLDIRDGSIHFQNSKAQPPVDIHLDEINSVAVNLTNSRKKYERLPASVRATARPMGQGRFELNLDFNPFEKQPAFKLEGIVEHVDITAFNEFIRYYAGLEPKKGTVGVYTEFASSKGDFQGYVKPLIKDVQLINTDSKKLTLGQKIKSVFAQLLADILKNRKKKTVATKVEFSGRFDDPQVSVWSAIRYVFRNGFVEALKPQLEHTIKLQTIKR